MKARELSVHRAAGILYREFTKALADDPGEADIWQMVRDRHLRAQTDPQHMESWFGPTVDELLLRHGLVVDQESRMGLMAEVARVMIEAADRLERHSKGDYRPDPVAERFPAWESLPTKPDKAKSKSTPTITFDDLFGRWMREASPSPSTIPHGVPT